jgi:tripartite-type tricarboxylate transporter receptor subunit TctC
MNRSLASFSAALMAAAALLAATAVSASDYPTRAINLIVPYPPGGPNDVIARTLGPELSQALGKPVVIENRPGAGGNTATGYVAKVPADGYTVLLPGIPFAVNPFIFDKVPYAISDFKPISIVAQGPLVLVVHPSLNIKSTAELIAAAKAKPGAIAYASGGTGTSLHLSGELFKRSAGIDMLHVPYKGTGELMADLLAGRTPVAFVSPLIVRQHVESGKLTALGVTSLKPLRGMEQVPTVAQSGSLPGFEAYGWYGLLVPAGTPSDIVEKLSAASTQALKSQSVQDRLFSLGLDIVFTTPAQADAYIKAETAKWSKLVKEAGIKVD